LRSYDDHLFEPLPQWVNETLAPAVAIALFEYDGITQAKLVTSPNESLRLQLLPARAFFLLPLPQPDTRAPAVLVDELHLS
jgi:hypothetical protein